MATSSPFTTGNDKKTGTATAEKFSGLGGNDDIKGMGGNDTISGGTGADTIDGGVGNDVLKGDAGKDKLLGGVGNDSIEGGVENDSLDGGNGNDTLNGGAGVDTMTGGEGNDTYIVDNIKDKVTDITTGSKGGTDLVSSSINYTLGAGIENLTLTGGKDLNGTGNDLKNVITGNAGSNVLNGGKGNDTIKGNDGDDTIDGGAGVDKLEGGDGSDVYVVSNNEDSITETAVDGDDDEIQSSATDYELGANIERLTLIGKGKDGIGNELANTLDGNELDNDLSGDAGDDTINGNDGNDSLSGGEGDDELNGGDGDDVVTYQGSIDDYKIIEEGDQWIVEDISGTEGEDGVDEGIDTITGVETLQFVDATYPDPNPNPDPIDDVIYGTEDDDYLTGTDGDDVIDGSAGYDVVTYAGSIDEYEIIDDGTGVVSVDGNEGFDTIRNVEELQFDDDFYYIEPIPDPTDITVQFDPAGFLELFEGDDFASLNITLSEESSEEVTVTFITAGSATANEDYWLGDGENYWYNDSGNQWIEETITFAPGETSKELPIDIYTDDIPEDYEDFTVTLTDAVNATVSETNSVATVGIMDDTYYY
ncbi:Calx-beta domain-containing protein [Chromatium okenii]|uniref:Calx-beta domain-containing protein n=1 Tax=Chromatium okenii TaxID=61644 RepID=UPI0026EE1AEF|nr:Calx-beta domain-containing protein [Chromatium okenii]MBV5309093.1 hypothetical protein [Chromatium okenii]